MQKYPHIIESYVCILKIFVVVFLLPIDFFGICLTPILHFHILRHSHTKLSNESLLICTHPDLLHMLHTFLGKLFLE